MDVDKVFYEVRQILGADNAQREDTAKTAAELSLNHDASRWLLSLKGQDLRIPWSAEELLLYGESASFGEGQIGYRADTSGARLSDWPDEWIVLGAISGDPVIGKIKGNTCSILFARHGTGSWSAKEVSDTVDDFADALRIWCELFIRKYSEKIYDDTCAIRSDFLNELQARIGEILPDDKVDVFMSMVDG